MMGPVIKPVEIYEGMEMRKVSLEKQLLLCNDAAIKMLDVQCSSLSCSSSPKVLDRILLQSGIMLYISSGTGRIIINEISYEFADCFVCCIEQGAAVTLIVTRGVLHYYMIRFIIAFPPSYLDERADLQYCLQADLQADLRDCSQAGLQENLKNDQQTNSYPVNAGAIAPMPIAFTPNSPLSLYDALQLVHTKWLTAEPLERFHARALFQALLYEVIKQFNSRTKVEADVVHLVLSYVEAHANEELDITQLAELAACSPRQLQRLFKLRGLKPPMEYVTQIRMERAQQQLMHTASSVNDIALHAGYEDAYYFSRAFKRYWGVSPLQYRRSYSFKVSELRLLSASLTSYCRKSDNGVIIKHMKGELLLQHKPRRIAALDLQFADQLVTLNETPAGSARAEGSNRLFPEHLQSRLEQSMLLGTCERADIEALKRLKPDFIVCTEAHDPLYEELAEIAPLVMFHRNEDWRNMLLAFGMITGQEQTAASILRSYQHKTALLADRLASNLAGQRVALIRPRDAAIRVHTAAHRTGAILYDDLRLEAPLFVSDAMDTAYHISFEALPEVDASHYFLLSNDRFQQTVAQMQHTEQWNTLEAVKQDHVYTVDSTTWIGSYGPLGINCIVEQISSALLA